MKRASSSAIAVAAVLVLVGGAGASTWPSTAWPSDQHLRGSPIYTQVWAVAHEEIWTNIVEGVVVQIWTNRWLSDIEGRTNALIVGHWETNLVLDAKGQRGLHAMLAQQERQYASGRHYNTVPGYDSELVMRPRFYRSDRDNLVAAKNWIKMATHHYRGITPRNPLRFVDMSQFSVATNGLEGAVPGGEAFPWIQWLGGVAKWETTNLLAAVGAPTNYCEYTPERDLSGAGPGKPGIMPCSWTIFAPTNGVVEFDAIDSWGNIQRISGTNGQEVFSTATNLNILAGFTDRDYTWIRYPEMMNLLVWMEFKALFVPASFPGDGLMINGGAADEIMDDDGVYCQDVVNDGPSYGTIIHTPSAGSLWADALAQTESWSGPVSEVILRAYMGVSCGYYVCATEAINAPPYTSFCTYPCDYHAGLREIGVAVQSPGAIRVALTSDEVYGWWWQQATVPDDFEATVEWYAVVSSNAPSVFDSSGWGFSSTSEGLTSLGEDTLDNTHLVTYSAAEYLVSDTVVGSDTPPNQPAATCTDPLDSRGFRLHSPWALVKPHYQFRGDY